MTKPRTKSTPPTFAPAVEAKTRRWATKRDAAAYAGIGLRTLDYGIASGEIPAYKLGPKLVRIDLNDIDALMMRIPAGETV